ncbi:MAG: hypothetical protein NNA31_08040 [Nitrospira sp.]|nr:hypothetical protein [Nitrospira sp.]
MARLTRLRIEGYRSIGSPVEIQFPQNQPVVLVGENNAGTSNIVKALQFGADLRSSLQRRAGLT